MKNIAAIFVTLGAFLFLSACGGGGSSDVPASPAGNPHPPPVVQPDPPPVAPPPEPEPEPEPSAPPSGGGSTSGGGGGSPAPSPPPTPNPSPNPAPQPPPPPPQASNMLELPEGTHGLDIAVRNGEGHVFRINPGDFFILGRTRFDCHGPEICDVQVNHFGAVAINVDGGTVTLELLPPALLRETDRTADNPNLAPRLAFGLSRSIRVPKSLPTFETYGSEGSRNVRSGTSADRDDKARITIRSDPSGPHGGRKYVVQTVNGDILTTGSADLDGDGTPDSGVRSVTPNALDDVGGFQGVELSHDRDFASVWSNRSDSSGDDWLAFGYWLRTPARVGVIGTAGTMWKSGPSTTGRIDPSIGVRREHFDYLNLLTGEATYTGPAAGLHAVDASVQAFTGSATLTADFNSPAYDPVGHVRSAYGYKGRLTGRIHDMMAAGASLPGEIMLQGYDNEADKSNIQPYYADAETLLTFVDGEASMGDLSGKWSATFAGTASYPSGVVGVFGVTGRTPEGYVSFIGSFAAGKQQLAPE